MAHAHPPGASDSRTNAATLASLLLSNGIEVERQELERRVLLVLELLDGVIRLVTRVDRSEGDSIINDYTAMAVNHVFGDDEQRESAFVPEPR